ncbi:winged helix-turn-helix domain-containing protein [Streptomyces monomycini]|uniref:winged helix-turn-helix domain-containing protein n=1 Tax=Streptomyces monomycini TaxID=371720 RepID=UPI0004AB5254|nr:helix-turn-helix domain-containing protein [Streptomyces monomycini]
MSDEEPRAASPGPPAHRARRSLPDHPVRIALLDLLAEAGTVTSTQAAARLGHSSGLCSFHLRQLARHGLIEEVPHTGGRARPWRLRWDAPSGPAGRNERPGKAREPEGLGQAGQSQQTGPAGQAAPERFDVLARNLEDESYQHWLAHRDQAPPEWRHDASFSEVVHLTPAETAELAAAVRALLAPYRERNREPAARPAGTAAVAAVTRLFPLLTEAPAKRPR